MHIRRKIMKNKFMILISVFIGVTLIDEMLRRKIKEKLENIESKNLELSDDIKGITSAQKMKNDEIEKEFDRIRDEIACLYEHFEYDDRFGGK